jgi:CubicO group peptidase (beta-lactamase class C family)
MVAVTSAPAIDESRDKLEVAVREIVNRWPAVGFAVAVLRDGRPATFLNHGVAEVVARTPVSEDTVFRLASLTKLFTSVAIMQLVERGLVDLDAPAGDHLRAYHLLPAHPGLSRPTVRHLLTHTSGIPEVIRLADLLHPGWGSFGSRPAVHSVALGEPIPPLATVYPSGIRYVVEPGTTFAYTNHGFATLGQIVEDVSGLPVERYLRERIFEPLGMADTGLGRSPGLEHRRATGYAIGHRGPAAVRDREWVTRGASAVDSTARDLARFAAALLGGGSLEGSTVLDRETLATMFEPSFRPDPRVPGMGLGFFRSLVGGHRFVGHDGRLPGFNTQLLLAPDDGVAVIGLTNGSSGATSWLPTELERLLRGLIGVPEAPIRHDIPHRPETWDGICGRYALPPRIGDLRGRLMLGGGVEVFVDAGRPMLRLRVPMPALLRGVPLHPDDPADPAVYRIDLSSFGMSTIRVVFGREVGGTARAIHTDLGNLSLIERRDGRRRVAIRRGLAAAAIAAGTVVSIRAAHRHG